MTKLSRDWNAINSALSQDVVDRDLLGELLAELGCEDVNVYRGGTSYRATCPVHSGDDNHNLQVKVGGHSLPIRWTCYSRQCQDDWKPSLLGLVRGALSNQTGKSVHPQVAVDFLARFLGGMPAADHRPVRRPPRPEGKTLRLTREQARSRLVVPSPYFVNRGFSPAVLDALDVGHSAREGKSIVPLHSDDGETCIGYMARSEMPTCTKCERCHRPGTACRYGQLRWTTMEDFPKGAHLYGYHAALRSPSRVVIVTEGPADVWKCQEAGYLAVALLGVDLSPQQLDKLAALRKYVFLAFDNDETGQKALPRALERLSGKHIADSLLLVPPQYKDIGQMPVTEVVRWPSAKIINP
jgi:Toprim-like